MYVSSNITQSEQYKTMISQLSCVSAAVWCQTNVKATNDKIRPYRSRARVYTSLKYAMSMLIGGQHCIQAKADSSSGHNQIEFPRVDRLINNKFSTSHSLTGAAWTEKQLTPFAFPVMICAKCRFDSVAYTWLITN